MTNDAVIFLNLNPPYGLEPADFLISDSKITKSVQQISMGEETFATLSIKDLIVETETRQSCAESIFAYSLFSKGAHCGRPRQHSRR